MLQNIIYGNDKNYSPSQLPAIRPAQLGLQWVVRSLKIRGRTSCVTLTLANEQKGSPETRLRAVRCKVPGLMRVERFQSTW